MTAQARDARTNTQLTEGIVLIIRDGTYADTARYPVLAAGPERAGTYDVRVQKAGYQEWTKQSVRVTRGGGCKRLRTVTVNALLQLVDSPQ